VNIDVVGSALQHTETLRLYRYAGCRRGDVRGHLADFSSVLLESFETHTSRGL